MMKTSLDLPSDVTSPNRSEGGGQDAVSTDFGYHATSFNASYALNDEGYKVIRFTNEEVILNPQLVAKHIKEILDSRQTTVKT
jgi:hypothetical protein